MAIKCTTCGRPIRPRMVKRLRKVSGGHTICRPCLFDKVESGEIRQMECRKCNKKIEPQLTKRIIRARKWGRLLPLLCKSCFATRPIRRRRKQPPLPPPEAPPVVYQIVYTTGDTMHTSTAADDDDDMPMLDVDEWECFTCAGPLEPDEVNDIRQNKVVECEYCGHTLTREQFT